MDRVHDRASIIEKKEDRISNLPDDIILHILSFLDMKYAIQTSILSKQWKHIWTSIPHLNLNSRMFPTPPKFAKFVKNALSRRNHGTQVFAVDLDLEFKGAAIQFFIESIVKYAYSHNVRRMSMMWSRHNTIDFSYRLFRSQTLKHLTLQTTSQYLYYHGGRCVPKLAWDFPVLETMHLSYMQLGDYREESLDLFSKCVNLKDLTLDRCSMFYLESFTVCAPKLCNLTITRPVFFPKVFNVVAPQLENLTASVHASTGFEGFDYLQLSTAGFDSLEKVNLSLSMHSYKRRELVSQLLDLFKKLGSTKFLILDKGIIEALSLSRPQLLHDEPCPFDKLKCLKQKDCIRTMPSRLKNYFLKSSPTATFIMDLPQEILRKQQVDKGIIAKKMAKKEEEEQQI